MNPVVGFECFPAPLAACPAHQYASAPYKRTLAQYMWSEARCKGGEEEGARRAAQVPPRMQTAGYLTVVELSRRAERDPPVRDPSDEFSARTYLITQ